MASNNFQIAGVKEIQLAFKKLGPTLARKVIRQAIRKGLRPVLRAAKRNTPTKTGRLKSLLKIKARPKKKRGVIALQVALGSDAEGSTFYGAFVDLGTKAIEPRHFMRDAFEETKAEAAAIAKREILAGIEREANK